MIKEVHQDKHIKMISCFDCENVTCRTCTKVTAYVAGGVCNHCSSSLTSENILAYLDIDTYFTPHTFSAILSAIDVLKVLIDKIVDHEIKYGYALVRPPGHHCCDRASGFCLVNNVVVTAKYAQRFFNKVLILDIDFHHGNGTEELVKDQQDIFFVSIHGYGDLIYPHTGTKSSDNILNIPINVTIDPESRNYVDDSYYLNIFSSQVIPFINNSNVDIIIVSNGLDGHKDDPLEGFNLTDNLYVEIAAMLKHIGKPIVYVTEGGYSPTVVENVTEKVIDALI
jgi:acetoin utilization deacetylase AcuC-like enzyme